MYNSPYRNSNGNGGGYQQMQARAQAERQRTLQMLELITLLPALSQATNISTGNATYAAQANSISLINTSSLPDTINAVNTLKAAFVAEANNNARVHAANRQQKVLSLLMGGGLGGGGINDLLVLSALTNGGGGLLSSL